MNPLSINPWVMIGAFAIVGSGAFASAWQVQEWRMEAKVATLNLKASDKSLGDARGVIADMKTSADVIKAAASESKVDISSVMNKLSAIDQRYKNAKPAPLPADCKPDIIRVRRLSDSIDAANEAVAGPKLDK